MCTAARNSIDQAVLDLSLLRLIKATALVFSSEVLHQRSVPDFIDERDGLV
jgi:hypothetical protein